MTATTKQTSWPAMPGSLPDRPKTLRSRVVLIAALLAAMLLSSCNLFNSDAPSSTDLLQQSLPSDWTLIPSPDDVNGFQAIDIDDDDNTEYLLFYRYDSAATASNGPIGGIIYDGQDDTTVYDPETTIPIPLQPLAFFVPYRLLPDWTAGKGQGYLGDASVTWEVTPADSETGFESELVVRGSNAISTTRLSLFNWLGVTGGYGVSYFQGSYSVSMPGWEATSGQRIDKVVTLDAFTDRSKLCKQTNWSRQGTTAQFNSTPQTVVFCLGAVPQQPTYAEAVVLAWLLTRNADFATSQDAQDQISLVVPAVPQQIGSLTYPGTATITGTGNDTVSQMIVESAFVLDGVQQTVKWRLLEEWAADGDGTPRWRIVSAD